MLSYAQSAYPVDSFSANQDNSDYCNWLTETSHELPINPKATTYQVLLSSLGDKYKLSLLFTLYDIKGNILENVFESYDDGVVVEDTNMCRFSNKRSYLFNNGEIIAKIDTQGVYFIEIDFGSKPLSGMFFKLRFTMDSAY